MGRYNHIINSFSAGELSQKLRARTDIEEYQNGLETMENFLPISQGGATLRPGTRVSAVVSQQSGSATDYDAPVVLPFIYSKTEAYKVVISSGAASTFLKVYKRNGGTCTTTYLSSTYFTLPTTDNSSRVQAIDKSKFHITQVADIAFITHESGRIPMIVLKRTSENTFTYENYFYSPNAISTIAYSRDLILKMPFRAANIDSAKTVRINTVPAGTPWILMVPGAVTVEQNTAHTQWYPGDLIRISSDADASETVVLIASQVSGTQYTGNVLINYTAALNSFVDNWNMPVYRPWYSTGGLADGGEYAKSVALHEQRLMFGGTPTFLDTVFCSANAEYFKLLTDRLDQDLTSDVSNLNHFGAIPDADPFRIEINSNEVNEIKWLQPQTDLVVGTSGAEFIVNAVEAAFGRSTITVKPKAQTGSRAVQPCRMPMGSANVSRDGQELRVFTYSELNGQAGNVVISNLSSEIIHYNPGTVDDETKVKGVAVKQLAWQSSRNTLWIVTDRNALISLTMTGENKVAFAKHELGGELDSTGKTEVFSVCCIPNEDNTYEDIYLLCRRSINTDGDVVTLEKIGDNFEHDDFFNTSDYEYDHPVYLDQALRFTAEEASTALSFVQSATSVITASDRLDAGKLHKYHLGQEVQVSSTTTLPTGLSAATNYYVIPTSLYQFQLATSLVNALALTAIDITAVGSGTITVTPTAVTTLTRWSGLDIYGGRTVYVFEDGVQVDDYVVPATGSLSTTELTYTATAACSEVVFGFPYTGTLKSMVLNAGGVYGSSRGSISRIDRLTIPVFKSYSGQYGSDEDNLMQMPLGGADPETTDITVLFPQSPTRLPQIVVKSDKPRPLTVLAFIARGVAYDG